jgi:hypothetical protein
VNSEIHVFVDAPVFAQGAAHALPGARPEGHVGPVDPVQPLPGRPRPGGAQQQVKPRYETGQLDVVVAGRPGDRLDLGVDEKLVDLLDPSRRKTGVRVDPRDQVSGGGVQAGVAGVVPAPAGFGQRNNPIPVSPQDGGRAVC